MAMRSYTAIVAKDGEVYVALCPEFDVASQGASIEKINGVKKISGVRSFNIVLQVESRQTTPMPRCLRLETAGGIYHVTSRGDRRKEVFLGNQRVRLNYFETIHADPLVLHGVAGSGWLSAIGEADIASQSDGAEVGIVGMLIGFSKRRGS